ncbi:MAG: peroxiredoxin [Actinomycetes bacterium]
MSAPALPTVDAPLEVGQPAPDFTLRDQHGAEVSLADYRGKAVVVVFYPFAFTGTCTGELCAIRDSIGDFANDDVQVLAVSCDPSSALRVFGDQEGYTFPLLSDFWPHGEVARRYGVFLEERGMATRGTFLVDREGVLRWSVVNGPGQARSLDEYRAALADVLGR